MRSFFRALVLSWTSPSIYREAAFSWHGKGMQLMRAIALFGAVVFLLSFLLAVPKLSALKAEIIPQLPTLTFEKQQLSIDRESPVIITVGEMPVVVFDTRDAPIPLAQSKAPVMFTRTQLITTQETKAYSEFFTADETHVLTPEAIDQLLGYFARLYVPISSVMVGLGLFLYSLFQLHAYSAVGAFINQHLRAGLENNQIMRISAVAMLPKTGLLAVFLLLPIIHIPAWFTWFMTVCFLVIGIKAAAPQRRPLI